MNYQEFLFYLMICFTLSFLIGVERQYRKRIIGLRTTILVSLGAFLFVSFSFSVGASDTSRIASQVVTGIGFLGAGVILKDGKKIRGLTTAATLWCDAAIGILCAGGAIFEAVIGTCLILFANTILRYINKAINDLSDKQNLQFDYILTIRSDNETCKIIKQEIKKHLKDKIEINQELFKNTQKDSVLNYQFIINRKDIIKLEKVLDSFNEEYNLSSLELKKVSELKPFNFDDEM